MLERILRLKDALKFVFDNEFRSREHMNTPTIIELMRLSDDDFEVIHNVMFVLTPFKQAQLALEGENYVNLSLLPLAINNIRSSLVTCEASADPETEGNLLTLIEKMRTDFTKRWGTRCEYAWHVVRGERNRQVGIPTYAFWATALDPRTKKKLSKLLPEGEVQQLWRDVESAIITLMDNLQNPNNNVPPVEAEAPARTLDEVNRLLNNNNNFFADSDEDEDEVDEPAPVLLADTVAADSLISCIAVLVITSSFVRLQSSSVT